MDRQLIADCVHCGFCLPSCPTYQLWGEEMDSPRGRIHLMAQLLDGAPLDAATVGHFDACLGCLACVTSCPSGVRYDRLIEATRAHVERAVRRPVRERAVRAGIFALFPYPRRLARLRVPLRLAQRSGVTRIARRLPDPVATMARLLPPAGAAALPPEHLPADGVRRRTVGLLLGCVQRAFFPHVGAATARVLAAEGCEVLAPRGQGCCGALSLHAGREQEARDYARRLATAFAGVDTVVVDAAGCGSALKSYGDLLPFAVRDLAELLDEMGPAAFRHPLPITVAYHDACHLGHAQGIRRQPRELLRAVPGLRLHEIADGDLCCGSAGVYNLLQPEAARALGERKATAVTATGADLLVTANPGCLLQIAAALDPPMPTAHTVEVLDASIRGLPPGVLRNR